MTAATDIAFARTMLKRVALRGARRAEAADPRHHDRLEAPVARCRTAADRPVPQGASERPELLSIRVTETGVAAGIVQWMEVDLAEGITFDNHPDGYTDGGWLQVLHTFPESLAVEAGDVLHLAVGHDRTTLIVRPLEVASARAQPMVA